MNSSLELFTIYLKQNIPGKIIPSIPISLALIVFPKFLHVFFKQTKNPTQTDLFSSALCKD